MVYDLDNNAISLAQTVFNATTSNIVQLESNDGGGAVPSASSPSITATAPPVTVTGKGAVGGVHPQTHTAQIHGKVTGSATFRGLNPTSTGSGPAQSSSSSAASPGGFRYVPVDMAAVVAGAVAVLGMMGGAAFVLA